MTRYLDDDPADVAHDEHLLRMFPPTPRPSFRAELWATLRILAGVCADVARAMLRRVTG